MNQSLHCFTLRDFSKSGGGSIRISGMINALQKAGVKVHLHTLFDKVDYLHEDVVIHQLPSQLSYVNKRKFQLFLSILPIRILNGFFKKEKEVLMDHFSKTKLNEPILFFEYLDNSLAYFLKSNRIIESYIQDIHGIVPLEFLENYNGNILNKVLGFIKSKSAELLDQKTLRNAKAIIFPSEEVKSHFLNGDKKLTTVETVVVEEGINDLLVNQEIDRPLLNKIKDTYSIKSDDIVVFFAGDFKPFGGIEDLVLAFVEMQKKLQNKNVRLFLIGDGQLLQKCKQIVVQEKISDKVTFAGRVPYTKLKTYQEIADIIVCPDKNTSYSNYMPHIKYFDSLVSGKIVINGAFSFTEKLNPDEKFSLNFEPSDVQSLARTIQYAIDHLEKLRPKFENNKEEVLRLFAYDKSILPLINYIYEN